MPQSIEANLVAKGTVVVHTHQALYLGQANKRNTSNIRALEMKWMYDNDHHDDLTLNPESATPSRPTGNGIVFCWIEESKESGHDNRRSMVHRLQTDNRKVILQNPVDLRKTAGADNKWGMSLDDVERRLDDAIAANPEQESEIRELASDGGFDLE